MSTYITMEDWTASSTSPDCDPGQTRTDATTGITYVYVYNAGADAVAASDAVGVFTTLAKGHVSVTDATMFENVDGTTTSKAMAGIAVGAIAAGSYGWLIAKGFCPTATVTTDGTAVSGGGFALKDATSTVYHLAAAAAHLRNGYALAADVSTALTGFVLERTAFLV